MLSVTDAATEHLTAILTEIQATDEQAVRLVCAEDGVSLAVDSAQNGDTTFEHQGKTILVLDEQAAERLGESTLDVEDTEEGPQLGLR